MSTLWYSNRAARACGFTAVLAAAALLVAPVAHAHAAVVVGPGTVIVHGDQQCTVGFTGLSADNRALAFTAGHCRDSGDADAPVLAGGRRIGYFASTVAEDEARVSLGDASGFGVIELGAQIAVSSRNSLFDRVLQGQHTAAVGEPICHLGARSGLACGAVTEVTPRAITAAMDIAPTDSGGPAFLPTGPHSMLIVGIVVAELDGDRTAVMNPIGRYLADVRAGYGSAWSPIATLPS
ncbi:hypothetical protein [Nocardia brasiliensis]|uniref:hypothetical protein n=1 Tax=Nocardia brasiliensis TaxID=37326 RepID=UPI0024544F50|nr:hypothetical protein [Nocardia brasiliensis]